MISLLKNRNQGDPPPAPPYPDKTIGTRRGVSLTQKLSSNICHKSLLVPSFYGIGRDLGWVRKERTLIKDKKIILTGFLNPVRVVWRSNNSNQIIIAA
ncbi:MAG TPA: hypothetical protein VF181_08915 [Balneolaceae bacterium]